MNRLVRPSGDVVARVEAPLTLPDDAGGTNEPVCPNCLTDLDEAGYCSGCSFTMKYERAAGGNLPRPLPPLREELCHE